MTTTKWLVQRPWFSGDLPPRLYEIKVTGTFGDKYVVAPEFREFTGYRARVSRAVLFDTPALAWEAALRRAEDRIVEMRARFENAKADLVALRAAKVEWEYRDDSKA